MSFPRYPKYKNSGLDWLAEVPEHWSVEPFKRQVECNDGGVWGDEPDGENDTIVLRSTEQTVDGRWQLDDPAARKLSELDKAAALLVEGDLLLTKSSGSALHIGKTSLVTQQIAKMRCCYSNFMQRIRMKSSFSPALAWYVLNNDLARRQFDLLSNSTTGLANLNASMIGQIIVPVSPVDEQEAILTFLDRETEKIDALVTEQRRLMVLLKEKRQAVVSHAVTKGLNPHTPMKDSGIEWLGGVPAHWVVMRLRDSCSSIFLGLTSKVDYVDEGGIPLVRALNIAGGVLDLSDARNISKEQHLNLTKRNRAVRGDVLLSKSGSIGTVAIVDTDTEFSIYESIFALRARAEILLPQYLLFLLRSDLCSMQYASSLVGMGVGHLNMSDIVEVRVPLPPIAMQVKILSSIEKTLQGYDGLALEARRAIELLQERRTALISAAVTGQIDVRQLAENQAAA